MKFIKNKTDFDWHTQYLDVSGKYNHRHSGEPERYPCIVLSDYCDDPNGPYTYFHSFYYEEEHECGECGHKTKKYPLSQDQLKEVDY